MGGFAYHNNTLAISTQVGIQAGQFIVSDLLISSGQDPNHLNNRGDVHLLDMTQSPPSFNFTVGRHKTDAIADFWNHYVQPQETTVDDKPGSLNFAFTGSLVLTLTNPPITATINNVAIGQGSYLGGAGYGSVSVNNWWFGGQTCTYEGGGCNARCYGVDQSGTIWEFHFSREEYDQSIYQNTLWLKSVTPNGS